MARSVRPFPMIKKTLLVAVLVVCLAACSDRSDLDDSWLAYQQSLSELTAAPVAAIEPSAMPVMPRSADLRIEIDRLSIGLLDSLRLDRCRLGQVLAQRNSALGLAQSPAPRLRYELDSILAIEECLQSAAFTEARIPEMLNEALEHKQATLPQYIDQVLTRSDAFRHTIRAASRSQQVEPDDGFDATYAALMYFAETFDSALQGRWQTVDLAPYNSHMQVLMQNDFLPRHWRSMQRSAAWLSALNKRLSSTVVPDDCRGQSNPAEVFAGELQPVLARWVGYQQQLEPVLHQLKEMSVQQQWRTYIDGLVGKDSHAQQIDGLIERHNTLLTQTHSACQQADLPR